jgi:hypothetical protein
LPWPDDNPVCVAPAETAKARKAEVLMEQLTACFKNVNNCLNTKYQHLLLETSGGQSHNLYLNVVQFFNISVN